MPDTAPLLLVSLKSFGDLIIARWAARQIEGGASPTILMGEHLSDLNAALADPPRTRVIRHGENGVPALFDLRKRGWRRGILSALHLRSLMGSITAQTNAPLVFDRIGPRERFIAAGSSVIGLPRADNVYLAHASLLGFACPPLSTHPLRGRPVGPRVGIFPGSRLVVKTLSAHVVTELAATCLMRGCTVEVFALEGERFDWHDGTMSVTTVPRNFAAMSTAVRSVDAVISADSMPAHMAEFFGLPVFVVSPVSNPYWLPLSSFLGHRWTLFEDVGTPRDALPLFLSS